MIHAQFTVSALAIVETTSHIHNAHDEDKDNDNEKYLLNKHINTIACWHSLTSSLLNIIYVSIIFDPLWLYIGTSCHCLCLNRGTGIIAKLLVLFAATNH